MKRVVIHAGSHKTGTTSIQSYLDQNRGQLRDVGWEYPTLPDNHRHKISHFAILRQLFANESAKRIEAESFLRRANESSRNVILSAESMFGQPTRLRVEGDGDYWQRKTTKLGELRNFFLGRHAEVIIYLRDRNAYLTSLFRQSLRVTKSPALSMADAIDDFLKRSGYVADYAPQVEAWKASFDLVTIVDYDQLYGQSSVQRFCHILGIPAPAQELQENKSPDWAEVEMRRRTTLTGTQHDVKQLNQEERDQMNSEIAAMVEKRVNGFLAKSSFREVDTQEQ